MHDWCSQSPPKRLSNDCQSELEDEVQGDVAGGARSWSGVRRRDVARGDACF